MDLEKQKYGIAQALTEYEQEVTSEGARRKVNLSIGLKTLNLEEGAATPWFDSSEVEGKLVACRIVRSSDKKIPGANVEAVTTSMHYSVEIGVTTSNSFDIEDDPNLYVSEWAKVDIDNSMIGLRNPELWTADGGAEINFDTVGWTEVEYTIQRARDEFGHSSGQDVD